MKVNRKICEDCDMECFFFMNKNEFYVLCMNEEYIPNLSDELQNCFSKCFQETTHYIRHFGKMYRKEGDETFGYGKADKSFYRDDHIQYRYNGWNPFKRMKVLLSKMAVASYWKMLDGCKEGSIILPKGFACPYEMEHKLMEWNDGDED